MALKIYWTKRADKKFDQILDYLLVEWGETVAKAFTRKVYDFLDILSEFPENRNNRKQRKRNTWFYDNKTGKSVL